MAAGAAGIVLLTPEVAERQPIWDDGGGLVGPDGEWVQVATVSDVPVGQAVRFSTPAFDGYVVNDDGEIRALGGGLHAHGLHAAVPAGLERPALPVPRGQLRPERRARQRPR